MKKAEIFLRINAYTLSYFYFSCREAIIIINFPGGEEGFMMENIIWGYNQIAFSCLVIWVNLFSSDIFRNNIFERKLHVIKVCARNRHTYTFIFLHEKTFVLR